MTRYCKDCQHFRNDVNTVTVQCMHPMNQTTDPVWGKVQLMGTPHQLRAQGGACGPAGTWWEKTQREEERKRWPTSQT